MIIFRNKYHGIISEFCFKPDVKIETAIVLCDGIPTAPKNKELLEVLAERGYLVFYPRYKGTWESEGEFLKESPVLDIYKIVDLIKGGDIPELWGNHKFGFKISKIIVVGVSFGGAVAMSCAKNPSVNKVLALSPIFDFTTFNKIKDQQDLGHLGKFINRAFTNGYRMDLENWQKLLEGKIFNPIDDLDGSSTKKISVLQSRDDTTVSSHAVEKYAKKMRVNIKIFDNLGHFSLSRLPLILKSDILPLLEK